MHIQKATHHHLPAIMAIYHTARQTMRSSGNPNQWTDGYPSQQIVEDDIRNGYCHLCVDQDGEIVGVFCFFVGHEPTYDNIYHGNWTNNDATPYGVIHRIASSGTRKGVGAYCINWCYTQHSHIRIDTHRDNVIMQRILSTLGFKYCGVIYLNSGDERLAYEK